MKILLLHEIGQLVMVKDVLLHEIGKLVTSAAHVVTGVIKPVQRFDASVYNYYVNSVNDCIVYITCYYKSAFRFLSHETDYIARCNRYSN